MCGVWVWWGVPSTLHLALLPVPWLPGWAELLCQAPPIPARWRTLSDLLFPLPPAPRPPPCPAPYLLQDMHQEIQDVMGTAFGVPDDVDEDELMGELEGLEDELAAEPAMGGGSVPAYLQDVELPEVPQGQAQQKQAAAADDFGLPAVPQRT